MSKHKEHRRCARKAARTTAHGSMHDLIGELVGLGLLPARPPTSSREPNTLTVEGGQRYHLIRLIAKEPEES